ncbi:hypothetical protein QWJ34_03570 [Saccharibacillus sp. CPCC 101409]|uniref:hypothetical protein n=1 Tax=Saccharibacillus sp. CPCC 101409 TaxID=3058041 RepID=UPI00267352FC|nr:hypothetical protein [Saccharibacillus sp. CPCC 101409]MDO3408837.1 hypothetical protein [Saccharibacillus sp. CPCC 101409]
MTPFPEDRLRRVQPAVASAGYPLPAESHDVEVPPLNEAVLEEAKAAVDDYVRGAAPSGLDYFPVSRQPAGVLENEALPAHSPVQIYGRLQSALGLLRLIGVERTDRMCRDIEDYMDSIRETLPGEPVQS